MKYQLSQHAAEVILEREINREWIDLTLDDPQAMKHDPEDEELMHHFRKIEEYGNRVLRVVFNKRTTPVRLVTVYFDRTMKGRI